MALRDDHRWEVSGYVPKLKKHVLRPTTPLLPRPLELADNPTMDIKQGPTTEKQHIATRTGVCGGKPCIAGTRIRVWDIHVWHDLRGMTPAEIVAHSPQLSVADVYAAEEMQIRIEYLEPYGMAPDILSAFPETHR